ncbi:B3 domain-containing protein Os01g0234100-like [Gastrolobium bilobum]|uniref:B3 domain-containing protein Os01g0234100-like n=1 Tax=Gastrolobium bilobum TaxID=150636 RepID=UPI002AAF20E8|nr:B3 domain-containing protein Os01g0234100-like [Gastrolobium bilobum]
MVLVDEKNRDRVAKKEVVELPQNDQAVTVAFHGEELNEDVPLAHLSKKSPLTMDKQNKAVENKNNSIKVATDGTSSHGAALIRAEEMQSNLESEFPSFVKSLVRSHVASCFWMGLPVAFCRRHLPDKDTTITLEDESGKEYKTKYIACKTGLSAGWRQFSAVHKLQEGDVVVFQLVEPTKFKVCIIRANNSRELDGALSLLNLDSNIKQKVGGKDNANTNSVACNSSKRKHGKPVPQDIQKKKKTGVPRLGPTPRQSAEQSENDSEEALSEVLEGFKMLEFKNVKRFEDFSIIVDGMLIDAELSTEVRNKYYKLCYSQHAFLHDNLIKGLNYKLIAGIISETVNIADAIKISVISTPRVEFASWDKTLLAFEHLGMNVEFLRIRLRRLVSIAYETDDASETKRYLAYRSEHSRADDEIKNMETKLEELKGACNGFGAYLESLRCKAESYQLKFQKEVTSLW